MFIYRFCTVYKQTKRNNELKPITTVSIDHVLPKIYLEIEHVLIGGKTGADFQSRKSESFLHDTRSESRF